MESNSKLKQPFAFTGLEMWIDTDDRLMISIPLDRANKLQDEFTLPIRTPDKTYLGSLRFKKQLIVKTQVLYAVTEWLDLHSQSLDQPSSLLHALGLFRSNS